MTVIKCANGGFAFQLRPELPAQGDYKTRERAEFVGERVAFQMARMRARRAMA